MLFVLLRLEWTRFAADNRAVLGVTVLILLLLTVVLLVVGSVAGGLGSVLFAGAIVLGFLALYRLLVISVRNRGHMKTRALVLLLTAAASIAAITIGMREGVHNFQVNFDALHFLSGGSGSGRHHFFLNVVLFVPFGVLFPLTFSEEKTRASTGVLVGTAFSTWIEVLQYCLSVGECDIDDILANTLGTFLGVLAAEMILRRRAISS